MVTLIVIKLNNMKKILLGVIILVTTISCSLDDSLKNPISNDVCNCDRVIETNYKYINTKNGSGFWTGTFRTKNDCTLIIKDWVLSTDVLPKINTCLTL